MTFDPGIKTLQDLMRLDSGYAFKSSAWTESGTPVIKIRNVQDGYVDLIGCSFVNAETANKAGAWYGEIGNTLIALTCAGVGEIGRIRERQAGLINQRVGWVRPKNSEEEDYIYYLLRFFKAEIIELAGGSAQPNVAPKDILRIPCAVPPKAERKAIGAILSSLDEKIAIINGLSKTLENIAQTIFKSWFMEFDPVKAKMAGEKPEGMDAATAALFPDSMVDSALGLIPNGWDIKTLGEVVDISWGDTKTTKASYVKNGFKAYSAKGQDGFLSKFDYFEMGIVLSAIGANCGKTWLATGKWSCIKNTMRIIANSKYKSAIPYVYFWSSRPGFWERRGTAQPFIGQEDSKSLLLVFPCESLVNLFSEITNPIFNFINQLSTEIEVLTELRNSLLPRLISGELQIPEEMLPS